MIQLSMRDVINEAFKNNKRKGNFTPSVRLSALDNMNSNPAWDDMFINDPMIDNEPYDQRKDKEIKSLKPDDGLGAFANYVGEDIHSRVPPGTAPEWDNPENDFSWLAGPQTSKWPDDQIESINPLGPF